MWVETPRPGEGSGEKFVLDRFPGELTAYRKLVNLVTCKLVVMIDGDANGVRDRLRMLDSACNEQGVQPRKEDEAVAIFVPTRKIETWIAYLAGQAIDEKNRNYPRLIRSRDCQPHVDQLVGMSRNHKLREPAPQSLEHSCQEYLKLLED